MKILFTETFKTIFAKGSDITERRCDLINKLKNNIKNKIEQKHNCKLDSIKNGWQIRDLHIGISANEVMSLYKEALSETDEAFSCCELLKADLMYPEHFFEIKE